MRRTRRGFTMIEMLTVIAIIVALSGLLLSAVMTARSRANVAHTKHIIAMLMACIEGYQVDFGDYPPGASGGVRSSEVLYEALTTLRMNGPYSEFSQDDLVDSDVNGLYEIADHWGNPIRYYHHSEYGSEPRRFSFRLVSPGPDGDEVQDEDNVNNW